VQVPVPEHPPPDQPVNVEPDVADALRVTWVPASNWAEQVVPQLIAPGGVVEVTVPVPVPAFETVSVYFGSVNVAVTPCAWFMVTVQVPVPEQPPPDQPVNVDPDAAEAVRVTWVPASNWAEQVVPQLIAPAGAVEVTVPVPVPALATVSVYFCGAVIVTGAVAPVPATWKEALSASARL
jgi:hypothetical protein